uniref:Uncharacterized protein n=1 Tax=Nymphaea colorata TaxID=210225 RepID=A0A5K0Z7P2_9MAGN
MENIKASVAHLYLGFKGLEEKEDFTLVSLVELEASYVASGRRSAAEVPVLGEMQLGKLIMVHGKYFEHPDEHGLRRCSEDELFPAE